MNALNGKIFTAADTYNTYSSAQTNAVVYTPSTGKKVAIMGYSISTSAANVITIKIGTTTVAAWDWAANGGANISSEFPIAIGTLTGSSGTINVTSTGTTNIYISFWGREI